MAESLYGVSNRFSKSEWAVLALLCLTLHSSLPYVATILIGMLSVLKMKKVGAVAVPYTLLSEAFTAESVMADTFMAKTLPLHCVSTSFAG